MTRETYPESPRAVFGYALINIEDNLFAAPGDITLLAAKENITRALARLDEGVPLDGTRVGDDARWRQTFTDIFDEMDWSDRNPDGTRKYPDKPEYEIDFEADQAIAYLLRNDITFMRSDGEGKYTHYANINDIFAWGFSEAEEITADELEEFTRNVLRYPVWGSAIHVMIKRRQMPQKAVADHIIKDGISLNQIEQDSKLRPSIYDNSYRISNLLEKELYEGWCKEQGKEPCESWHKDPDKDRIPGMRTPEFYERFKERRKEWALSVGYEEENV